MNKAFLTNKITSSLLSALVISSLSQISYAGPFAPAAGQAGSTAISANSNDISSWATGIADYTPGTNLAVEFMAAERALGEAGNSDGNNLGFVSDIVSLGRGGSIVLTFEQAITNGEGADFAVFENSFSDNFLELAYVEVSSNGTDFQRFNNMSLTANPISAFGSVDPTNITGLAGKYRGGFGTPFDLADLAQHALVDINAIIAIRLIDIVGDGSAFDNTPGAPNRVIYDPFPTTGSAGFDLDAIGVIHAVPVPASVWLMFSGLVGLGVVNRKRQK